MQNRHNLEQEEEVDSEQLIAKEAFISWKWRPDAAGITTITISRSWTLQQNNTHQPHYILSLDIYRDWLQNFSAELHEKGS